MAVKHTKVSAVADGADTTKIRPQADWNADHTIDAGTVTDTHVAAANKDGAAGTASMRTLGTGAAQAAAGDHTTPAASVSAAGHMAVNDKRLLAYFSAGNSGTSLTIDWNNGASQHVTMTGNCTFTFSNPAQPGWYALRLAQDATGSRTATWPATVKWSGASAPTLTTTASRVDLITFYWDGAAYLGASILNFTV